MPFCRPKMNFSAKKIIQFGKNRKFLEERVFIRGKRSQLSEKHLCKSWRPANMPVVAGRLVM